MEKPEIITAVQEMSSIALSAAKLCVYDALKWVDEKIDDALYVWTGDGD